jgi:flagellar hook-associated protein 1 FlgK
VSPSGSSVVNSLGADVSAVLTGGSLQAETDFLSTSNSTAPGTNVVGKILSQLQNFANLFVSTATSPNSSFASTYNSATPAQSGELASGFFTATTDANTGLPELGTFAVNPLLVNGTSTIKQAATTNVANTFSATNLAIVPAAPPAAETTSSAFTATGLTANNQTYSGIANAILSGFQQAANTIQTASTTATTQKTYYQTTLSSATGVNTDTELVNLTNWQNSYAASAHVISTIQSMFTILEGMVS